jgi:hypothetical protein
MARYPRLVVPGVAMHVHHRGNNRQDCFFTDNIGWFISPSCAIC